MRPVHLPPIEANDEAKLLLAVPCRFCGADVGICCRAVTGNLVSYPHMARVNDAGALQRPTSDDGYLEYATAVVLNRMPTPKELELARTRGISNSEPWVKKARAGLDVNRRIDRQPSLLEGQ